MSKKKRVKKGKWTLGEKERLLTLSKKKFTWAEIARDLGRTEDSVRAQFRKYGYL